MTVPRENGLVRFYVQLDETSGDVSLDSSETTLEEVLQHAQKILQPYTLEIESCDWHSVYTVSICT
jgi:phenol 2-monooxygenase